MEKEDEIKTVVPVLRFPEFSSENSWKIIKFSKYIELFRGSSPRPIKEYLTEEPNGINWIKIGDTQYADNFMLSVIKEKITKKGAEKSRYVHKGELILANSMSFGKTYQLAIDGCIYDGWFVLRGYENSYCKPFLLQLLNSDYIQNQYKKLSAGGIVLNISSEIVYQTHLFYTSKQEQRKIADCLASLDDLIDAATCKIEALKEHKKGLMQRLFPVRGKNIPELRFPEFLGMEGWKENKLKKLCEIGNGKDYKHLGKGNIPVYGSGGYMTSVDDFLYDGESVCIGRKGTIDKPMFLTGKFWTVDTLFYTHSFRNCLPKFLYLIFQQIDWYKYNEAGGVPSLSKATIGEIAVFVPIEKNEKQKEQQKITDCLFSLDELIGATTRKVEALKEHKKGLMQQLFPKI